MEDAANTQDAANTLRILVASDCHLGYLAGDEIRGDDSYETFEEICSIADQKQVDFLLLGGNLFHDNPPSLSTLSKALMTLQTHCYGERPVAFQVVNKQNLNFQSDIGRNISLPVFSIHGDRDDPTDESCAPEGLSSGYNLLSMFDLLNYFGETVILGSDVGRITVNPILIKKGSTAVALYGLGNIDDDRLNTMLQTPDAVQWMHPESQEGCQVSDWFNILVLHQERNSEIEHSLPDFLDFIVWGHEHECLVDPEEVPGKRFRISQPGSSIATSISAEESTAKHVLLLEIKGNQYCSTKIPLESVRPLEFEEIILQWEPDIDPNDENSILEHLDKVVVTLLEKCKKKADSMARPKLPLIRVRVNYYKFPSSTYHEFGNKYEGKVLNHQTVLTCTFEDCRRTRR